jgi:transposase
MLRYIGLDVHKRVVEACALDAAGQVLFRRRFELSRDQLLSFAQVSLGPEDRVVLEATTNTWAIVGLLKPWVAEVVVSNPLQTKAIATAKIKTDKVDALVLAQLLRCDFLPRVWEPDEATQQLRRLTNRRAALVADRTGVKNRLHAVLAMRLVVPAVADLFGTKGQAWLQSVPLDGDGRAAVDSDLRLLAQIEAELAGLDTLLAPRAYAEPRVRLLMTLPGVDYTVAQTLLAALGDIGRFHDADQAAAYLGLVPSTRQSATHCYQGPITKQGSGHARWLMVQAAQHVGKHPGPLGVFFRRLAKKKNRNVAVVATARKLVCIAWHMLKKNEPYRYAQPQSTHTKLLRLRVRATGQKRRGGTPRGQKRSPRYGTGQPMRTVKSLTEVLQSEGLPLPGPAPAGEARTIAETNTAAYVAALDQTKVVARKPEKRSLAHEDAAKVQG